MNRIQLTALIRTETRTAITEAISAQEKKDLQDIGQKLATWAEKNYQVQLRDAMGDREDRDLAERDRLAYIKIADACKNGNAELAWRLTNRLDTAAADVIPTTLYDGLQGIEMRMETEHELTDQLMLFKSELKSFDQLVKDRKWANALERWKNLMRVEADNVQDALEELA